MLNKIQLRKFPYPFKSALAICNDIDGTSFENFIKIHKFLNSKKSTDLGQGLGLPISDSFWMFDNPNLPNAAFSYFQDLTGKESRNASVIREFIQAGILDVMHSYGNFSETFQFSRKIAELALNELNKRNLKVEVWTNHGGIESFQNIGSCSQGFGDIYRIGEASYKGMKNFYHTDLLTNFGINFYWDTESQVTSVVGQDRNCTFSEAYWKSPLFHEPKLKMKSFIKGTLSYFNKVYFKYRGNYFLPWPPTDTQNSLFYLDILRDGNYINKFKRFGNGRFDWSEDFPLLLNDQICQELIANRGFLILYIHLGDRKSKSNTFILCDKTVQKFKQLAELYNDGKIWIQSTSSLLKYNWLFHNIDWSSSETESKYIIQINGTKNVNSRLYFSEEDFSGITFEVPKDKETIILFKNHYIKYLSFIVKNESCQIAMIPLKNIEWPL